MKSNEDKKHELTEEDLQALGKKVKNLRTDDDIDQKLKERRGRPVDFSAKDLDVPGSELDDAQERRGTEDEENNHYSLGTEHNEKKG
ncbi:hypothetical protein [Algoriphagus namhaensis]